MSEIGMSVITPTFRPDCIRNLIKNFRQQNYKNKELIIVINNNDMKKKAFKGLIEKGEQIKIFQLDEQVCLSVCLNFAIQQARYDYIARFDDDDYYGSSYLKEAEEVFKLKHCDIVNKGSIYCFFKEANILIQRYKMNEGKPNCITGGAIICAKKQVFKKIPFIGEVCGEDTIFLKRSLVAGCKICSSSKYNFLAIRSSDVAQHTYKAKMETYLKSPKAELIYSGITLQEACDLVDQQMRQ